MKNMKVQNGVIGVIYAVRVVVDNKYVFKLLSWPVCMLKSTNGTVWTSTDVPHVPRHAIHRHFLLPVWELQEHFS